MKQKLLVLICLITFISWGKSKERILTSPAIGLQFSVNSGTNNFSQYRIKIKNIGDEPLTNIYVANTPTNSSDVTLSNIVGTEITPIPSLAPGQEDTVSFWGYKSYTCFDSSQIIVYATTISSTQISDLSSNYSYYEDDFTQSYNFIDINAQQDSTYQDLNGNSIVDVGDVINYFYSITTNQYIFFEIHDDNAIVDNPNGIADTSYFTTGMHYITATDIQLGYVYNNSYINVIQGECGISGSGGIFQDYSPCSCPNPQGANIVTQLTSLLPNKISGTVKYNTNNDNCATGSAFTNQRVSTTDGTYTYATYSNTTGNYHILIPNIGNYTTNALTNLNTNFSSNPASVAITSSGSGVDYNNTDFCIGSSTNYTDLNVNMFNINQAIPGNIATYRIYYTNYGSTSLNGSIQLTYDNAKLSLGFATPTQNNTTANTLTWNYTNLLPFETRHIDLSLSVAVPPFANANDTLNFSVNATPIIGDAIPSNNTISWNQTVRSSFDPNDKTVIEGSAISLSQASNYLTYVTRFQNTGTANATTVVIKDTLDPKLDWNTFEPIASSHASNIQIQNGSDVTYTFSNIDLSYSAANEPASHGWMVYRIKPKNNVVVGDIMSSNSNIYFDYNLPINTNTVATQITALAISDFIKSNYAVYPNPASNYLVIKAETDIDAHYEIIDINGKLLLNDTVENRNPININALQSGFYFMTIKTNQGKATYKFIKK